MPKGRCPCLDLLCHGVKEETLYMYLVKFGEIFHSSEFSSILETSGGTRPWSSSAGLERMLVRICSNLQFTSH